MTVLQSLLVASRSRLATTACFVALTLGLSSAAGAQPVSTANPNYVRLATILDARVDPATPAETATRTERDDEKGKGSDQSDETPRATTPALELTVADVLLTLGDGRIQGLVVRAKGGVFATERTIVVPPRRLRLDGGSARLDIPLDTLAKLSAFDLTRADGVHLARAQTEWSRLGIDVPQDFATTAATTSTTTVDIGTGRKLLGRDLFALDTSFGTIERVILDWRGATLAFAVIARAPSEEEAESVAKIRYLLPWNAVTWSTRGSEVRATVRLSPDRIENAGIEYFEDAGLVDAAVAERARKLVGGGDR